MYKNNIKNKENGKGEKGTEHTGVKQIRMLKD
jgi:hypothetical protein